MTDGSLLIKLKELSEIDGAILRILAERIKLQKEYDGLKKEIEELKASVAKLQGKSAQDKLAYERETRRVKLEREGLVLRRQNLSTLGNYKLQQAAGKEIDAAEKALSDHEDSLLSLLDSADSSEKTATEKELLLLDKEEELSELLKDLKPTLETLAEREAKEQQKRAAMAVNIDPKSLSIYEGSKTKLAPDTLSSVVGGACDFCNLQVPPQMLILVTKGDSIQKCRGCSRILYVDVSAASKL